MGRKALFGYALHLSIASSLVLKPPQSLPESTSNLPSDPDTSSNSSMTQTVPITSKSSPFSIPNAKSSLSFANITTLANNATLTEMAVSCGDPFPRPGLASFASCKDAWEYIPSDVFIRTFGDRASGFWSVTLPQRFMSDDGLCVIDFDIAEPGRWDRSSMNTLMLAAHAVVALCVLNHNRAGEVTGLGQNGHLTVSVKQYSPGVQCTPTQKPPIMEMCRNILDDMPATKAEQVFGSRDTPGVDVPIPWDMATPGLQCVLKVRMRPGPAIRTSWYQIWEQAVALTVLCVQPGEKGLAEIYAGGQPRIAIVMLNEARQGLTLGVPDDTS